MVRGEPPASETIRELSEVPAADWQTLSAGDPDPFGTEYLNLSWRSKDTHFVLYSNGRAASHVSVLLAHTVRVGSEEVRVTGIAGVLTRPDVRNRGFARHLLDHALGETQARTASAFGLLFCLPRLVTLYQRIGWEEVGSPVFAEQPSEIIRVPLRTMFLSLRDMKWPTGPVFLDSPPW